MNHKTLFANYNATEIITRRHSLEVEFKDFESMDRYLTDTLNSHVQQNDKSNTTLLNDGQLQIVYVDDLEANENLLVADADEAKLAIFDGDVLNHEMITIMKLSEWYQSIIDDSRERPADSNLAKTALVMFINDMMRK